MNNSNISDSNNRIITVRINTIILLIIQFVRIRMSIYIIKHALQNAHMDMDIIFLL